MSLSKYQQLYTPEDTAIVFIDHQPQMTFGVDNIDKAKLMNNVSCDACVFVLLVGESSKLSARRSYFLFL